MAALAEAVLVVAPVVLAVLVVLVVLVVVELVVLALLTTWSPLRGVKFAGTVNPVGESAAVRLRV